MSKLTHTFCKEERLCSKKSIDDLFTKGSSFNISPLRVIWMDRALEGPYPAKILISISKKHFQNAVDRNRIKRLIREAYRKNKNILYAFLKGHNKQCIFCILYQSKELMTYSTIESKIILILQRLTKEYEALTR